MYKETKNHVAYFYDGFPVFLGDILKMAALKTEIDYILGNNLYRTVILVPIALCFHGLLS